MFERTGARTTRDAEYRYEGQWTRYLFTVSLVLVSVPGNVATASLLRGTRTLARLRLQIADFVGLNI